MDDYSQIGETLRDLVDASRSGWRAGRRAHSDRLRQLLDEHPRLAPRLTPVIRHTAGDVQIYPTLPRPEALTLTQELREHGAGAGVLLRAENTTMLEAGERAALTVRLGEAVSAYVSDGDWRVFLACACRVYDLDGRELTAR